MENSGLALPRTTYRVGQLSENAAGVLQKRMSGLVCVRERRLRGHELVEARVGPVVVGGPRRGDVGARLAVLGVGDGGRVRAVRRKVEEPGSLFSSVVRFHDSCIDLTPG